MWPRKLAAAVALAMALYHIYVIIPPLDFISPSLREVFRGPPTDYIFRGIHLHVRAGADVSLVPPEIADRRRAGNADCRSSGPSIESKNGRAIALLDWLLIAASIVSVGYIFVYYDYIIDRIIYVDDMTLVRHDPQRHADPAGAGGDAARAGAGAAAHVHRVHGCTAISSPVSSRSASSTSSTCRRKGIFGQPLAVSASYVMIFVLFGAFMERTGTGQLFMDFAMGITGHTAGGPGKVSVVSSSLFGTISGSAVANVMVDGPISIPLMKRTGFKPHFAAAVEATASTGGQIMPPIMGAAAFVMAEFQGVSYAQVVIWALSRRSSTTSPASRPCTSRPSGRVCWACRAPSCRALMQVLQRARPPVHSGELSILFVMYSGYSAPLAALTGTLLCFPVAWFGPVIALRPADADRAAIGSALDADVDTVGLRAATRWSRRCCSRR